MTTLLIAELLKRALVIVAHPDDECIGAGTLLQRMQEAAVVFCTDGGPRATFFWRQYGSREEYVSVRRKEAEAAGRIVGIARHECLPIVDQELYLHLKDARQHIDMIVADFRPDAILTLAYEGGHPDHDCCAFLSRRLGDRHRLPVWEAPLYHRTAQGARQQEFVQDGGRVCEIRPTEEELARKEKMRSAYVSQASVIAGFDLRIERFRRQPAYDFERPPNEVINYEFWKWPVTAAQVSRAFAEFGRNEERVR